MLKVLLVLLVLVVLPLWLAFRVLRFILRLAFLSGMGSQVAVVPPTGYSLYLVDRYSR